MKILIVDEKDRIIGKKDREECHRQKGILHRAFLMMIFNKGRLLLAKRSRGKKLWPLFWDVTVASHFQEDRNLRTAVRKRVKKELGISLANLKYLTKFRYQAKYREVGSEKEICYLYQGNFRGRVSLNKKEASDYKILSLKDLKKDIKRNPKIYTPWLKIAIKKYAGY